MPEEVARSSRVFGRDNGDFSEDAQCAKRDVFEVADGGGHHEERAGRDDSTTWSSSNGRGVHARILLYDWELGHCRMSRLGADNP
jgi:hypothetical protein